MNMKYIVLRAPPDCSRLHLVVEGRAAARDGTEQRCGSGGAKIMKEGDSEQPLLLKYTIKLCRLVRCGAGLCGGRLQLGEVFLCPDVRQGGEAAAALVRHRVPRQAGQ